MSFDEAMLATARRYLLDVMERHGWDVTKAAREAGRNRTSFYVLLKRCGIQKPRPVVPHEVSYRFHKSRKAYERSLV